MLPQSGTPAPSLLRATVSLCLILAATPIALAGGLTILTEDAPPLNYIMDGGGLTGVSFDVVREIQRRVGDDAPIKVWPWARAYYMVENHPDFMLFSMARSEERETLFKWVGPIGEFSWAFIALKGSGIEINSLDDARELGTIGVYLGDIREEFLRNQGFTNLDVTTTPLSLIRKLLHGRNDVILFGMLGAISTAQDAGLDPSPFEAVFTVKTMGLYCAFSSETPDETIDRWQKALDDMKADGTFQAIHNQWQQW